MFAEKFSSLFNNLNCVDKAAVDCWRLYDIGQNSIVPLAVMGKDDIKKKDPVKAPAKLHAADPKASTEDEQPATRLPHHLP